MLADRLARDLHAEIARIPLLDSHSHIDPLRPTSKTLDDILNYHYYTELAHSAGMDQSRLASDESPRERVRSILAHMDRIDNTAQYSWFVEIAQTFLGYQKDRVSAGDCDWLWENAEKLMAQPDWEEQVLKKTNVEMIFLTNNFDDSLEGFDNKRYIPCLRTDDLVFHLGKHEVRDRLNKATNTEVGDAATLRQALATLFAHFKEHGARACAISLPPDFTPIKVEPDDQAFARWFAGDADEETSTLCSRACFWMLAELCLEHNLPFDLMIGVNRRVYEGGVFQGQDLFDSRTSLIQYRALFNAFPDVRFPVSVLSSVQNQELVSYSWIFPNVITHGHWWYSNIPAYIAPDLRARLQAVPKTKQLGYYSDAYKLEFVLPKFAMYRRILANVLADDFVRPGVLTETQAVDLARLLLRENTERIFCV